MNYPPNSNNITKQKLIDLIQSLPDAMVIGVFHRVPQPDGVDYLPGYGYEGILTDIVSSATKKCEMNIYIEYTEKIK